MNKDILKDALKRRKGRKFNVKEFMEEKCATPGMDSPDLEEKTSVVMGGGVKEKNLEETSRSSSGSTDDLAPSKQELKAQNVEMDKGEAKKDYPEIFGKKKKRQMDDDEYMESDVGGSDDESVFDEMEYKNVMRKKKPRSLYERMQYSLGKKLGK